MKKETITTAQIKSQPVVNKKGKTISASLKLQSNLIKPYQVYTVTIETLNESKP